MPKKNKAAKNTKSNTRGLVEKRDLVEADIENQVYGIIEKVLGDRYFDVKCFDAVSRRCRVRNKRLKIQAHEYVIVALREFDNKTGDIIYRYNPEEVRDLQKKGILSNTDITESTNNAVEDEDIFVFEDI